MKLCGKVLKPFNDGKDNLKKYNAGKDTFEAEAKRYNELYDLGYVEKGKEVNKKKNKDSESTEEK